MSSGRNLKNTLENIVRMELGKTANRYNPITPKIWRFRHSDVLDFIARRSARWT
jgi:hypothetical protein